ncbi:MAG: PD-(D/E)XK nuclease family protein [Chloroflexi bacterium]|nr:MAG: PD-(D/E)XK nuclease family protein [Chloroflexota bacterium]
MSLMLARVRPGAAAEGWLDARLAELRGGDPLTPATIVVPSNYAGLNQRRRLAVNAYANIRTAVMARLAEMAGAPELAAGGRLPLSRVIEEAAIRRAVREVGGLGPQTDHRAVVTTLKSLFRELADRRPLAAELDELAGRGGLAEVALKAHASYRAILARENLYERADLCAAGAARLRAGRAADLLRELGPILLFLPARLTVPELDLLQAFGEVTAVDGALPWLEDSEADAQPARWAEALGRRWDQLPTLGEKTRPRQTVLVAPDAGEEVRAAVRAVLAGLDAGVPLHRTALAYRSSEPYKKLVRETLEAAGLPWVGLEGRPISESFAGRGLLGLLQLQSQRFSRNAVLNWLSSLPHGGGPSLAQWDRISRDAGVVRSVQQWSARLDLKLIEDRRKLDELQQQNDDMTEAWRRRLGHEIADTEQIQGRIEEMNRLTRPPENAKSWAALAAWAKKLRTQLVKVHNSWPEEQVEASHLVDEVLDSLAAAPEDDEVSVERFVETLEDALGARRRPEGRLGQGVVTGPISGLAGMKLDQVFLLGMTERAYPAAPPADPVLAWESGQDPLSRVARRLQEERLAFLGTLAGSGGATFCYPRHDADQRPAYPSRWLLDVVAELEGRRVGPVEMSELAAGPERPWLRTLVSAAAALAGPTDPINVAERQVAEAWQIHERSGDLLASALAGRDDLPLGRGLRSGAARASGRFTEFDGNVAAVAPLVSRLSSGLNRLHPISASGIEQWAGCPFRYFLNHILEVEPTRRPEDEEAWSISPIDRGKLVHAILQEFLSTLNASGRPGPAEAYTQADREVLADIARQKFQELEERGQTGYRLAWLNEQSAIQLDLQTVLSKDEEFRREHGLTPAFFEQRFGFEEAEGDGWAAAEIELEDGTAVRLRGYIDRVDLGDAAAYITDYKTGVAGSPKEFADDPVVAGTKVQLAVYSKAVRQQLAKTGQVTAAYWYISPKGRFMRIEVADAEAGDQRLAGVVGVVNQGILAGAFPQVPGEDEGWSPTRRPGWSNCRFCDYHRICPTGRDLIRERKRDEPGANLHQGLLLEPPR